MGTGFEVTPSALSAPAMAYDDVAVTVSRVRASLRAAGLPSTGRPETTGLLASVVEALTAAVDVLGRAAVADADDLRAAATGYTRADATAVRDR